MNTVFTESAIDIYNNCTGNNVDGNVQRIYKLLNYSNKELARISYIFSQTVKLFTTNFSLHSRKFNKTSYDEYIAQTSQIN